MTDDELARMSSDELRAIIERLDETQVGLARFLGYNDSTVRRWIAGRNPPPITVEMLLRVMAKYDLKPDDVAALMRR